MGRPRPIALPFPLDLAFCTREFTQDSAYSGSALNERHAALSALGVPANHEARVRDARQRLGPFP